MKKWTEDSFVSELRDVCATLGHFPPCSYLMQTGRGDLANQIVKRGGFLHWSEKIGVPRVPSDSDFGWRGEKEVADLLRKRGFFVTQISAKRAPYDLLVESAVKVDVKSANMASYGRATGWFYRIGKQPCCDVFILFQADTKDCYIMPWWCAQKTNMTISRDGGIYRKWKNNFNVITEFSLANEQLIQKLNAT